MRCAGCHHDNPAENRFCGSCGRPLSGVAADPSPAAYTPPHLAREILNRRFAMEGERKQVSVMFADIEGSMSLAGSLDPEEWHELLDRFFRILTEGIHRFEGTVNQYTGDGVMALFGAPIAHEDHAERACSAALEIAEALRIFGAELHATRDLSFRTRIGINSGHVVVGKIGDDLRMDYTAQGQTVGLAQRVEQLCEAGGIALSEATARIVEGRFALRNLGSFSAKGIAEPLRVYALEGFGPARSRLEVARDRGLSQFVGRDLELRELDALLTSARSGQGRVLGLVGEAGVGKSRLCLEFLERCRSRGVRTFEAHCASHARQAPFVVVLDLFRNRLGLSDRETPEAVREKVVEQVSRLEGVARESLPILLELLGAEDPHGDAIHADPELRRSRLVELLCGLMSSQGGDPTVVLIDDAHWIDPASDALLAQLADRFHETGAVLVVNYRPEYTPGWEDAPHVGTLALDALDPEFSHRLAHSLLGDDSSVSELLDDLRHRTGGNPFFTEEVVQSWVETGHLEGEAGRYRLRKDVGLAEVPASVQAVLSARIDRLPDAAKHLLQTAAVIGRQFSTPVLASASGLSEPELAPILAQLRSRDFLSQRVEEGSDEGFKHPLSHEVAYESLLRGRRRELHGQVARALESNHPNQLDEKAALIANHWERSDEPGNAVAWHERAGLWTLLRDTRSSLQHWLRVRELAATQAADPVSLSRAAMACARILNIGWQVGMPDEEAVAYFKEGTDLASRAGNTALLSRLNAVYASMRCVIAGVVEDNIRYAEESVRLAKQTESAELSAVAQMCLCNGYFFAGQLASALKISREVLERMPSEEAFRSWGSTPRPALLTIRAMALFLTDGDVSEAFELLEESLELSIRAGMPEMTVHTLGQKTWCNVLRGRSEEALTVARELQARADQLGTSLALCHRDLSLGRAHFACRALGESRAAYREMLVRAERRRTGGSLIGAARAGLAGVDLAEGEVESACQLAESALRFSRERGLLWDLSPWLVAVRSWTAAGDVDRAVGCLEEAEQLVARTGAAIFAAPLRQSRIEVSRRSDA